MQKLTDVLEYWFEKLTPADHFKKSEVLDQEIRERFSKTLEQAARGELFAWRRSPQGRLAEIIVLDQFSRNIYRDEAKAFAQDGMALTLSQEMVELELDKMIIPERRSFVYMPYMHSESKLVHEEALLVFDQPNMAEALKFEKLHKAIIDRFGRYPHRNKVLGRTSTADEIEFLKGANSSF